MASLERIKVVSLGGGSGLSTLLAGLKYISLHSPYQTRGHSLTLKNITAIVTVSDDGGSSGRIRDQFQTPAPGDIRNCMVALAEDESLMTELFRYRFRGNGELRDHSLGNLLLTALTDITGDFHKAIQLSSQVLAIEGTILPSTKENVTLRAILADGKEISGETRISKAPLPVERLLLEPSDCRPLPEALKAIQKADIITIGPGSLFTSLIPNLVVGGIADAICKSRALKIYIGNLMTQPGETDNFSASRHLRALREHTSGRDLFDQVLLNSQPVSPKLLHKYKREGARPVTNDLGELKKTGSNVHKRHLINETSGKVRHNSVKLAAAVLEIFEEEQ